VRNGKTVPYHDYWALDIKASLGDPIYAAGKGKVVDVVHDGGLNCNYYTIPLAKCPYAARGNYVIIEHGPGVFTFYTHMSKVLVKKQDEITDLNTPIGLVGDSGWSVPKFYHLHYELRTSQNRVGVGVDPGKLYACVGGTLKTYPDQLENNTKPYTSWQGIPTEKFRARNEGIGCATPTGGGTGGGTTGGGTSKKVDLVFAIDTTGSMGPYIGAVTASATLISAALSLSSDARVALVDYKDLYASCSSDGYASQVDLPFTANAASFASAAASLRATGGCDYPESVYSGALQAIKMPWRDGARRAVIVMGDAPPHDPEPVTGYTKKTVIDAAKAGGVGVAAGPMALAATADIASGTESGTVQTAEEVGELVQTPDSPRTATDSTADTRKLAVAAAVADEDPLWPPAPEADQIGIYFVNILGGGSPYFEDIAAATGGQSYSASDPTEAVDRIVNAVIEIATGGLGVDAGGPYSASVGEPVTFSAFSSDSPDVTGYDWDVNGDGTYDTTTDLPLVTHTYTTPFTGQIGVRVNATAADGTTQSATDTADLSVQAPSVTKYTGTRAGLAGSQTTLQSFAYDTAGVPLAGAPITMTLGTSQSCTAITAANGSASCKVLLPTTPKTTTVTAFAEPATYFRSSITVDYTIGSTK
jgi:hypothetical protein